MSGPVCYAANSSFISRKVFNPMAITKELYDKLEEFDPKMKDLFLTLIRELEEKTKFITVARSDFDELRAVVKELAQAQTRTEKRVQELAEAQKRTEETLRDLLRDHKDVKKQLGGLSMDVGYGIEDRVMPHLLRQAFS